MRVENDDGNEHELSIPTTLVEDNDAINVRVSGSNIEFCDYCDLLMCAASAVGISGHYFQESYLHETSNIQDAAMYVRLDKDVSGPVHARTGPLVQLSHVLENDRSGYRKLVQNDSNERGRGESDEAVTQRFLREAVRAREADALEAIGVEDGDELRSLVEREWDPGESLDDAVRRFGGTWGLKTATGFVTASIIALALVLTLPGSIAGTAAIVRFMTTALMWVIGFVAIVVSIVANILLARPFRATFGFGVGDAGADTHATAGSE